MDLLRFIRQIWRSEAVVSVGRRTRSRDFTTESLAQQERDIEAPLLVPGFQRRGKCIFRTSAGLAFQEHANTFVRQFENFLEDVSSE